MTKGRSIALASSAAVAMLATVLAASAGTHQKPPIKIGVTLSLTGGLAPLGIAAKNGIVLRARQINAKGGVNGRKIELRILDEATNPATAIANTNRLIDEGADAIIGWTGGQTQAPASPVAMRRGVFSIAVSGYNEGQPTAPTHFWAPPSFPTHIAALTCYITKVSKPRRVGIISSSDAGSTGVSRGVAEELRKAGISVAYETVPLGASDATVAVSKVRDSNPNLVFVGAVSTTGGLVAKTIRDLGMKGPVLGWLGWGQASVLKLYGSALNGVIHEGFLSPSDPLPHQRTFVKTWGRNYPNAPLDAYPAWAYDSVSIVAEAFRRVPNATQKDGLRLARAIEGITYQGVVARWQLGRYDTKNPEAHTGMRPKDVIWLHVRNGEVLRLKRQPKC